MSGSAMPLSTRSRAARRLLPRSNVLIRSPYICHSCLRSSLLSSTIAVNVRQRPQRRSVSYKPDPRTSIKDPRNPLHRTIQDFTSTSFENFSTDRNDITTGVTGPPKDIGVIGGGITGLATAYFLRKKGHSVTIYSDSEKLGGWIRSEFVNVGGGDGGGGEKVLFEGGPRTLRPTQPNGAVTASLVEDLGLREELIITRKSSPGAKSRWLYYPDHLVQMPGGGQGFLSTVWSLLTEPIYANILFSSWSKFLRARDSSIKDESVGDMVSRRVSKDVANNIVSAVFHGIYAGDIWKLSAEALTPALWYVDGNDVPMGDNMSALKTMYKDEDATLMQRFLRKPPVSQRLGAMLTGASFFTFKKGLAQLSDALVDNLEADQGITIKKGARVTKVALTSNDGKVEVSTEESPATKSNTTSTEPTAQTNHHDQIISTIAHQNLLQCTPSSFNPANAYHPPAVTVGVINLYYRNPSLLPVQGFGYLIPQSIPFDQNPELALGVIFDSCAVQEGQDTAEGTKLTVMMGGHWWNGWSEYPDEEQLESAAKSLLQRHLGINEEPTAIKASLHKNCIPQYEVGHRERMAKIHRGLMETFKGRVKVGGSSYHGVGVNDCIRTGLDLAELVTEDGWEDKTGLEKFEGPQLWAKLEFRAKEE